MTEIKRKFKCNCKELSISANENSFLVICGKHINGAYCAFPSLNISAELSAFEGDYDYNKSKLIIAFANTVGTEVDEVTIAELSHIITDTIQELPDIFSL